MAVCLTGHIFVFDNNKHFTKNNHKMNTENATPNQTTRTKFYCQWVHGAREYFNTLQEAIKKAEEMYKKTPSMTDENYKYWLSQHQVIGMETVVETEIFYVKS